MLAGDKENSVGLNTQVTIFSSVRDLNTSKVKQLAFANGTKFMHILLIVLISENLEENNTDTADQWAKQLLV